MSKIVRREREVISKDILEDESVVKMFLEDCDIEGDLVFPKNLEVLSIEHMLNFLNSIPTFDISKITILPKTLTKLVICNYRGGCTDMSSIPLPMGLTHLEIKSSDIRSEDCLPALPDSLETIVFHGFSLNEFNRNFPKNLKTLKISWTTLISVPTGLPDGLKVLNISSSYDDYEDYGEGIESFSAEDLPKCLEELHFTSNNTFRILGRLPENLKILDLSCNNLRDRSFKDINEFFPESLTELNLDGNAITRRILDVLPHGIKKLNLGDTPYEDLEYIQYSLPGDLEHLRIGGEQGLLPDELPKGLKTLEIFSKGRAHFYKGRKLPTYIPEGIEEIRIGRSLLKKLPNNLPNSLKVLSISYTLFDKLPKSLPENLVNLNIGHSRITKIPENLPGNLKELSLRSSLISSIPDNLPDSLVNLDLSNCLIDTFPNNLPKNLQKLFLYGNKNIVKIEGVSHSKLNLIYVSSIKEIKNCDFENLRFLHIQDNQLERVESMYLPKIYFHEFFSKKCELRDIYFGLRKNLESYTKTSIATMEAKIAKHTRRDLHQYANFIKGHFEFWSLREEGLRFHQAHQEFQDFLTN